MIKEGTNVKWKWGDGYGQGEVKEKYQKSITLTLQGSEVTRNGSEDDPALRIKQDDGDEVLKLQSEVERADS